MPEFVSVSIGLNTANVLGETKASDMKEEIIALKKILGTIKIVIHRRVGGEKRGLQREPPQMHGVVPEKAVK